MTADGLMIGKVSSVEPETDSRIWSVEGAFDPIIAAAIHDGHRIRAELEPYVVLGEDERLREEDPYTAEMAGSASMRIVGLKSRFEVDLNRPREKAVYLKPEDAWGLKVYDADPPADILARSLQQYDAFYGAMGELFDRIAKRYPVFAVLDLHTYNHRRAGPDSAQADPDENPEVNIGTGTMVDRDKFAPIIETFIEDLRRIDFAGSQLDVRENVRFRGGNFAQWLHSRYPGKACVLSVEFKKIFMDEWTGELHEGKLSLIKEALASTFPNLRLQLMSGRYVQFE